MQRLWIPIAIIYLSIVGVLSYKFFFASANSANNSTAQLSQTVPTFTPSPLPSPLPTLSPLPLSKTLTGGNQTFQTFNNCGPSALSMALSYYGVYISQQTLGQQLRPYQNPQGNNDDKSVTLAELAKKSEELGFIPYHRPAGDIEIIKKFIAQDMPVITRTWLHPGEDIGHFRVVKGFDENARILIQDDSLQGANLYYSYGEFLDLWHAFNYEFLVLVPIEKKEVAESILYDLTDKHIAWQKALAIADQDLSRQPNDIYAQFNRSVALYYLERYQESIHSFETVQPRLPSRMLWYQLEPVLAYYQLQNFDKVIQISDSILRNQNRAYSELYYLKGKIFEQRNQIAEAQEEFRLADFYNSTESWKENVKVGNYDAF